MRCSPSRHGSGCDPWLGRGLGHGPCIKGRAEVDTVCIHFWGHHALRSSTFLCPPTKPFINTVFTWRLLSLRVTSIPLNTSQRLMALQVDLVSPTNSTLSLIVFFSSCCTTVGYVKAQNFRGDGKRSSITMWSHTNLFSSFSVLLSFQPALLSLQLPGLIIESNLWVVCLVSANIKLEFTRTEERKLHC